MGRRRELESAVVGRATRVVVGKAVVLEPLALARRLLELGHVTSHLGGRQRAGLTRKHVCFQQSLFCFTSK